MPTQEPLRKTYQYMEDGASAGITWEHMHVHLGEMFIAEYSASVNNGANLDFQITAGAKEVHLTFGISGGGQMTVYLYETPDTSGGTGVTSYNMNRTSTATATCTIVHTPSVSGTGSTPLVNGRILAGGSTPQTRIGGAIKQDTEFVLKPSTKYMPRATNSSGGTISINVACNFYEE